MSTTSTDLSHNERPFSNSKPLTVTVGTACTLTGLGPTKVWALIKEGRLEAVRLDGRTLIKFPSLERLLSPAQDEQPAPRKTPRKRKLRAKDAEAE
jgi:excisionase family DNA binding protein